MAGLSGGLVGAAVGGAGGPMGAVIGSDAWLGVGTGPSWAHAI